MFPIGNDDGPVVGVTSKIAEYNENLVAIGYDGTTEGFYCLSTNSKDEAVYWFNRPGKSVTLEHTNFYHWIESCPSRLFDAKVYAGYKSIKDMASVMTVIEERRKFMVELLGYRHELVKPPFRPGDGLPRFNLLKLRITKLKESDLGTLTIKFRRVGSKIGDSNIEYVTVDVPDMPVDGTCEVGAYLFDPFNLPFEAIVSCYGPTINLNTNMRVKYKEIVNFL